MLGFARDGLHFPCSGGKSWEWLDEKGWYLCVCDGWKVSLIKNWEKVHDREAFVLEIALLAYWVVHDLVHWPVSIVSQAEMIFHILWASRPAMGFYLIIPDHINLIMWWDCYLVLLWLLNGYIHIIQLKLRHKGLPESPVGSLKNEFHRNLQS